MTKRSILLFSAMLMYGTAWGQSDALAFKSKQSFGVSASYSPTSSHVLIGEAEERKIWTSGIEYTLRMFEGNSLRIDYRAEVSPFFRETDPTAVATEETLFGINIITPFSTPERVVKKDHAPIGVDCIAPNTCIPVYLVYGARKVSHGMAFSPLGARAVFLPQHHIQPSFELDLGAVISPHALPVEGASKFNYQFSFGPGVQIHFSRRGALRLEYIFRHISNANSSPLNPGIDQGVFRLSLCHYW